MKVIVVMPAYNAEKTIEKTIERLPSGIVHEIIVVDDCSRDKTADVVRSLMQKSAVPIHLEIHEQNQGYGGNQKTCYRKALEHGADIVVMVHPDFQYDPQLVGYFVEYIQRGYFDMMMGSRIRNRRECQEGGMPTYKYYANRALTLWENLLTGQNMSEWHSGMRAYRRTVLEKINFSVFSNDFIFDSQMLFSVLKKNLTIAELPVPVHYFNEASSINLKRSMVYGLKTIWESLKQRARIGIYKK